MTAFDGRPGRADESTVRQGGSTWRRRPPSTRPSSRRSWASSSRTAAPRRPSRSSSSATSSASTRRWPTASRVTPAELAERTGCRERYLREWLCQQAASGYVEYDPTTRTFRLPPEQALALADDDSPAFIPGAFQLLAAIVKDEPHITERFRSGEGMGWHEHDHDLFEGTERFFRPGLPREPGRRRGCRRSTASSTKLRGGRARGRHRLRARRLDDPDGAGLPGLDVRRAPTTTRARSRPRAAPPSAPASRDRVTFEVASAKDFGGGPYDLVCVFDALHDMGDPVGAARARALAAGRRRHLDGRRAVRRRRASRTTSTRSGASSTRLDDALHAASLSQEVGLALGAQAGEAAARRGAARGRLQPRAARGRDAVQPRAGGPSVALASAASERRDALTPAALGLQPVRLLLGDLDVHARSACRRSSGSSRHSKTRSLTRQEIVTRWPSPSVRSCLRHREVRIAVRVHREAVGLAARLDASRCPPTTPGSAPGRRAASRPPRPGRCVVVLSSNVGMGLQSRARRSRARARGRGRRRP